MDCDKETDPSLSKGKPQPETLERASEELQRLRKQILVENLLKKGPAGKSSKMGPSSALNRVKQFLPMMKVENEKLFKQAEANPASVSLEVEPDPDETQLVEINLALVDNEEENDSSSDNDEVTEEMKPEGDILKIDSSSKTSKKLIIELDDKH